MVVLLAGVPGGWVVAWVRAMDSVTHPHGAAPRGARPQLAKSVGCRPWMDLHRRRRARPGVKCLRGAVRGAGPARCRRTSSRPSTLSSMSTWRAAMTDAAQAPAPPVQREGYKALRSRHASRVPPASAAQRCGCGGCRTTCRAERDARGESEGLRDQCRHPQTPIRARSICVRKTFEAPPFACTC